MDLREDDIIDDRRLLHGETESLPASAGPPDFAARQAAARQVSARPRILLPAVLFLATCITTYRAGGLAFAVPLMLILTTHELGHFFQTLRYHVPASLPYFIPMPISPIGTMGAVIGMQAARWRPQGTI